MCPGNDEDNFGIRRMGSGGHVPIFPSAVLKVVFLNMKKHLLPRPQNKSGIIKGHAMFFQVLSGLSSSHSKFSCSLIAVPEGIHKLVVILSLDPRKFKIALGWAVGYCKTAATFSPTKVKLFFHFNDGLIAPALSFPATRTR